ncbi:ATP-grasp domain-containing protein [Halomonas sp. HL-93]|uniref:ATP-grasp domain-containing protein n=1 Tax=Halomonas sp. HL-93 TaxID=1666906 RepID=UPI0007F158D3|nr:ATP-grasp domain-containing protein [Halomonas sp. HL-93]SBR46114.1 Phosphoribosylamine-glycine ligase [Halomonas sp. HL-93]
MDQDVAVVLGGTFPHRRLIENLKARGYRTLLIDYHERPYAADLADEHIRASTLDVEKVLQIARTREASLVISSCVDQANVIACSVSEQLGLPHPYSTETANVVTNKSLMKKFMLANGIPTSRFISVQVPVENVPENLCFPLIVKPSDSNSSKGVRRIDRLDELKSAVADALALSRSGVAIVEEFIEGVEIGIDCFVQAQRASVLMTKQRRKIPAEKDSAQQIYGCTWPAKVSDSVKQEIQRVASSIATSLGITSCPLMIQAIVHDDKISVIEFAARFGGGESCTIIEAMTGVDIIEISVNSFLGEVPPTVLVDQCQETYAETFLYASQGAFGKIVYNPEIVHQNSNVVCVNTYKTAGMAIGSELSSNNRVGAIIVRSGKPEEIETITRDALENIDVIDIHGQSIFRREIY